MRELIERQATIDAVNNAFDRETLLAGFVRSIAVRAIRDMPSVQPELDSETLIRTIETGITATNSNDAYSLGMRNGMRWCKSLIDGVEPKFEDDVMSVDDGKELLSVQPEPHEGHWIPHESPDGGEQYECSRCGTKMKGERQK